MPRQIPIQEAVQMNRHQRRALGKQNGVKIPSIQNLPKPKEIDQIQKVKKVDNNFSNLFK